MSNFEEKLNEIEESIRLGKTDAARHLLRRVVQNKLPRPLRVKIAAIARRLDLPDIAIRQLNPVVRAEKGSLMNPTDSEKAEYAANLIKLGATEEAIRILEQIPKEGCPESMLFSAFAHIKDWDYAKSIGIYRSYINARELTDYQRLVGKINLAAAYVHEELFSDAEKELDELRQATREERRYLLLANALQFSAEMELLRGNFSRAGHFVREGRELLRESSNLDSFFLDKLHVLIELKQKNGDRESVKQVHELRKSALERRHWETVRDCDFFECIVTRNKDLFLKLYFGSPFPAFRKRLLEKARFASAPIARYLWSVPPFDTQGEVLRFLNEEELKGGTKIKVGQAMHKLLNKLTSDFYRPFRMAAISSAVFPGEYYNPVTTPARMHQIFIRLRTLFKECRIPLLITENFQEYRIEASAPCAIELSTLTQKTKESHLIEKLRVRFPSGFRISEGAGHLEISTDSLLNTLRKAIESGEIERMGKGPATRYVFRGDLIEKKRAA